MYFLELETNGSADRNTAAVQWIPVQTPVPASGSRGFDTSGFCISSGLKGIFILSSQSVYSPFRTSYLIYNGNEVIYLQMLKQQPILPL